MADFIEGQGQEQQPKVNPEEEAMKLRDRLRGIIGRLEAETVKRIGARQPLEDRWLEDLAQYHGRYDAATEKKLNAGEKSKLFINMTRPKTDAMSARLMDLLFPTDDKNWGIQPTPVPRLTKAAEQAEQAAMQASQQVEEAQKAQEGGEQPNAQLPALQEQANVATAKAEGLQKIIEEGRRRSELMAAEIDDQLKESNYHAVKRDQIEDACKLGTGVTKGPVTGDKIRKGWQQQPEKGPDGQPVVDQNGKPVLSKDYTLQMSSGDTPSMRYVDIWSYFPDMDARNPDEGEGTLERHLMNPKKLKGLAQLPGFDKDAIRRLLNTKPKTSAPSYMATLRNITNDKQQVTNDDLYHVWEYSGPLSADDMRDLAMAFGDEGTQKDLAEIDPLTEINAVVWFCDGETLKFAIYPYDSGECMYSVFNLVKDESSIFGYGIPSIMRDPQKSLNASWRAMMDNAGLASGPQIVIATELIEPADGDWTLAPRKVWKAKAGLPKENRAFETFDIPMHQIELANIITLSKQFIDDMTAMPQIAQGEQGNTTKTVQGMALLMNSANVVFRRIVKNFDDDVTTPDIRRFYDWNMQFNPKEEIKGDYEVDARGSSVLLVREMQAQTLMAVATQLGGHPIYGPMLRNREVLRKMFQALMIPAADVVLTDNEIDALMASAAANDAVAQAEAKKAEVAQAAIELEYAKLDAQIATSNMENESKERIALIVRETELIKLAQTSNISLDQLDARLQMNRENNQTKERLFTAEAALESVNASRARARGEEPAGSGGYISAGDGAAA